MGFERISKDTWKDYNKSRDTFYIPELTDENYNRIAKPMRSTTKSAGYDFRLPFTMEIKAGDRVVVPTGVKWNPNNHDEVLLLYPRSSLGFKYGFTLLNTVGVIDADYYNNPDNEGHILIAFKTEKDMSLNLGEKFCQGIITKFIVTDDDEAGGTRIGGIGSTN